MTGAGARSAPRWPARRKATMTFGSGTAFVVALRERVDREFNFIIPKLPQGHAPVIDICADFRWPRAMAAVQRSIDG